MLTESLSRDLVLRILRDGVVDSRTRRLRVNDLPGDGIWRRILTAARGVPKAHAITPATLSDTDHSLDPELLEQLAREAAERQGDLDRQEDYAERIEAATVVSSGDGLAALNGSEPWPQPLGAAAYHGPAGEFLRAMKPHTEADPAALLVHLLVFAGSMMGRRAYVRVGRSIHHANLFAVIVGRSGSGGRKGTSHDDVRALVDQVDPTFKDRIQFGMSSGEGFIVSVCDRVTKQDDKGNELVVQEGADDKRALWYEPEFASVLAVMGREGNTLSAHIRNAWDRGDLRVATKAALKATGAYISIIGHVTPAELKSRLAESDKANGFGNRFLWALARRSQELPTGGPEVPLPLLARRISEAIVFARDQIDQVGWSAPALELWKRIYGHLQPHQGAFLEDLLSRAEPQVLRLALVYALLDQSRVIDVKHLQAAYAVWRYCEESCLVVFGDRTGNRDADAIVEEARRLDGQTISRTQIRDLFGRRKRAEDVEAALAVAIGLKKLEQIEPQSWDGRKPELYRALPTATDATDATKVGVRSHIGRTSVESHGRIQPRGTVASVAGTYPPSGEPEDPLEDEASRANLFEHAVVNDDADEALE